MKGRNILIIALIEFMFLLSGCESNRPSTLFTLMNANQTGIDFVNHIQETKTLNIFSYEYLYNGGGVAAADFNNDGLQDLYFISNQESNKLYLNKGDWNFEDITDKAKVTGRKGWKTGVAVADVNGDYLLDIYVCYSGPGTNENRSNELYINNGGAVPTFTERAHEFGLDAPGTFSTQASFFDYDLDGDLDMFLLNHAKITYSPFYNTKKLRNKRHPQFGNRLYRNDDGVYHDVSAEAGIHGSGINFGLGVSVSDLNLDGWPDIYVTNDYEEQDFFYLNNKNGTFSEKLKNSFRHIARFGMGCDAADYNNDLLPDVFVADMLPEDNLRQKLLKGPDEYDKYMLLRDSGYHHQNMRNMLQLNLGNTSDSIPQFSEIGQLAGVSATDWSWCPLFADLDNDGWKDLFITNGYLRDYTNMDFLKYTFENFKNQAKQEGIPFDTLALVQQMPSSRPTNYCFRNNGHLQFVNTQASWGLSDASISNGATYADLDNDGDLDVVVNNINEPAFVYQNNSDEQLGHHAIKIKLRGDNRNTFVVGAKILIRSGEKWQMQENYSTRGFQSAVPLEMLFGLEDKVTIDEIIIKWPDRTVQRYHSIKSDTTLVFKQGALSHDTTRMKDSKSLFTDFTETVKLHHKHQESRYVDFKIQYLLPYQLSSNGPCIAKADINGDGNDDFYVGGAAGQQGELYLSQKDGVFTKSLSTPWEADKESEDTDAVFFDTDHDGDLDLYVVSGSTEFSHEQSELLQDRLYINTGKANFVKAKDALPSEKSNGSCVAFSDFDHDGDLDLFIGGKSLPGHFPLPAYSYLLQNESRAGVVKFTDATPEFLRKPGMINSAIWFDYNQDKFDDLILAGDFTPIQVYTNSKGKFTKTNNSELVQHSYGLWSKLVLQDIDDDGDQDIVAGNAGLNTQFRATSDEPMTIHFQDFNQDGKIDPILSYYVQGTSSVYASRDEMLDQFPHLKKQFVQYSKYASSGLGDILGAAQLKSAKVLTVETLSSSIIKNNGNDGFQLIPMPVEAQFSKVNGILIDDFNRDGIKDILLAGNYFPYRVQLGRNDAGTGLLLSGSKSGEFTSQLYRHTGFQASGDVRSMVSLKSCKQQLILLGVNDDYLKIFRLNR